MREDDFDEAALDLDAIARFGAVPASVLINLSSVNPHRPGDGARPGTCARRCSGCNVRFTATQHMRLEFLLRVRDEGRQLAKGGGRGLHAQPARLHAAGRPCRCRDRRAPAKL